MKPFLALILLAGLAAGQSNAGSQDDTQPASVKKNKKAKSGAAGDIGGGAGNVGGGALKGAGSLAKGTGKGAVDLATLHPIDAATSVGGGAVGAGKDVAVGTVKGTAKVTRGVGKLFKKVL